MAMFTKILFFAICSKITSVFGNYPPQELPRYLWAQRLIAFRLINMTAELLHDTTKKLKHADKIRNMHKNSITFELGTISAGIQERFRRMLKIYRKYANRQDFEKKKYTISQYLHAYHVMQGDYNEIRLEKSLFYEIKKKHESTTQVTLDLKQQALAKLAANMSTMKRGKNRRKWSPPIEDQYYNFPDFDKIKI